MLDTYRPEFRFLTISGWNQERLGELGLPSELISPGVDLDTFRPVDGVERRDDMVLALGRSDPLKNLPLTLDAWRRLPEPRPELCLFGHQPELATHPGIRYVTSPSDAEVNELLNAATVFVQTSTHEGFCLPVLESMATGGAVVCTDAHGNRDYCVDGVNCLMPEPAPGAVADALRGPSPIPTCAGASGRPLVPPRPATTGSRGSRRWSVSCLRSPGPPRSLSATTSCTIPVDRLEILGHARRDPIEDPEPEHEHHHDDRDRLGEVGVGAQEMTPRSGWRG